MSIDETLACLNFLDRAGLLQSGDGLKPMLPLLGVVVGWLLGLLSAWLQQRWQLDRYYDAIYVELRDVHSAVQTRAESMGTCLQEYRRTLRVSFLPTRIDHFIFRQWFPQCVLRFTESERLSLTHIFFHLDNLNEKFAILHENNDLFSSDEDANHDRLRRIIQTTEGAYLDACALAAMIEVLLDGKKTLDIRSEATSSRLNEAVKKSEALLHEWAKIMPIKNAKS